MAVEGYVLISIPVEVQRELKNRGWVRNSVSYGYIISSAFKRIDELETENTELKLKVKQIDDIQAQVTQMATSLVGSINGNK
jgi:hypothetical protein